ncbi:hypothetical protein JonanDRAFT_0166 [Jonquetella anthropi DSM 22815]|uniref:Uncharacterized protein n=1 Tax=Jonquetella anthropi DSM 22815 TaxID=885272 RepID=H0UMC0_9BACT|nr:hypothetical protein JonanDRAFT_0166 [Jonquetella anthropi DSM 22815]
MTNEKTTETRHHRFIRLSEARVNALLEKIRLLGNLSSSFYEYSADEVNQIFRALQSALADARSRFKV